MTGDERMQRESNLIATIRRQFPEFAKACVDDSELVLLLQDAFADYQEDEYTLLNGDQVCRCFHQFAFSRADGWGHPVVCG